MVIEGRLAIVLSKGADVIPDANVPIERHLRRPNDSQPAFPRQMPSATPISYNAAMTSLSSPLKRDSRLGFLLLALASCNQARSSAKDATVDTAPSAAVEPSQDSATPGDSRPAPETGIADVGVGPDADAARGTAATGGSTSAGGGGGAAGAGGATAGGTMSGGGSAGMDGPALGQGGGVTAMGGSAGTAGGDARLETAVDIMPAGDAADVPVTDDVPDGSAAIDQMLCTNTTTTASGGPTDMLLVLDRSGSMVASISEDCCCDSVCTQSTGLRLCSDTTNCIARWPALTSAVRNAIAESPGINWGLKLFTTPGSTGACTVSNGVEVAVGPGAAPDVQAQIAAVSPANSTPTAQAITVATKYLASIADPNPKTILLATDGEPNCKVGSFSTDVPDVDGTIAAIQAAVTAGFRVYVVGIGPSVGNLDSFASAGGSGRYYPATSADALASVLSDISQSLVACTYALASVPPDPANVAVYVDGKLVAKDPGDGWSFGASPQTILLNGSACTRVTSAVTSKVQVLFGCPGTIPPTLL